MKKKTVFVGVSGGVDSAVSAALLKEQGYDVVGVFIRTWHPEWLVCNEEEERQDAMRICAHLDIPFLTFDLEDVYKKEVADYMIREYRAGRTPNPDVMCNREVKFGAFMQKALSMGADYVATGHYAQSAEENTFLKLPEARSLGLSRVNLLTVKSRGQSEDFAGKSSRVEKRYLLLRSPDSSKDQSYFLWTLKQEQLAKILFPIGHLKKTEVRKLAKKFKLPVAQKKDSQGICFLGEVDLKDFLKHYIKEKRGKVMLAPRSLGEVGSKVEGNKKNNVIGYHNGVLFYTLGERHGFTITRKNPNDGPYYVIGKDIKKNVLFVSQDKNYPEKSPDIILSKNSSLFLKDVNWIFPKTYDLKPKNYTCQIRYHGELLPCRIKIVGKSKAEIIFEKPILAASGQSVVLYDHDVCLGGGIII